MPFYKWSQTASSNGTADPTCPFPEGMAPSAVNDGVRGAMAALAQYRDDIAGAIVTAGTNTAYTASSFQIFDSLADMNGKMIAFSSHATNGAGPVTLSVDSLGAKPLRSAPGVELQAATVIQGTPYLALYNNTDGAFYLHGFYGNPYNIPLLGGIDYWGTTAPNSAFVFPTGQALSRTVYAAAFAMVGTTFGAGDGSTTFNLPDKRGNVSAAADSMNGGAAGRLPGFGLGSTGGAQTHTLSIAEVPALSFSGTTGTDFPDHAHSTTVTSVIAGSVGVIGSGGSFPASPQTFGSGGASARHQHPFSGSTTGGGGSHSLMQPTIACNYIIRII